MRIGVCGDDCELCPRYRATEDGDEEALEEIARLWFRLGYRDRIVSNDEIRCGGCRPENRCAYPEQRDCAYGRKLENCGSCECYPCELVERSWERTAAQKGGVENLPEFERMERAFFRKKENLDEASRRHKRPPA